MAKFLNDVKLGNFGETPRFVNATINPNEIVRAGTTGSELSDLVYNKAIETAGKIQEMKRQNELADIKIQASKNLQDYELSWADRDKYSDENYSEYTKGLNDIYEKNRLLVAGTKYTNESDVNSWDKQTTLDFNNANFKADGEKAQYDIKKITDETILKIDSLNSEYISTGDNNTRLQILDLYNGLAEIGVPKHEIEAMKVKTLVDSDLARTKQEIERTLNDENLTIEDKMNKIKLIKQNLSLDTLYDTDMQSALEKGYITKDSAEIYKSYAKKSIQDGWISAGGYIQRLEEQVRDEEYRMMVEQIKLQTDLVKNYNDDRNSIRTSIRSGNDINAINKIEGTSYSPEDILSSETLTTKYYGDTPINILKNDGYINTLSSVEVNDLRNKNRVDSQNNIPRIETVSAINDMYSNTDSVTKENITRQLISSGVITPLEEYLFKNQSLDFSFSKDKFINYASIGKSNSKYNDLGGMVGIDPNNPLYDKVKDLTFEQRTIVTEMITGAVVSGEFGAAFNATKGITNATVLKHYKNNSNGFGEYVDDTIEIVKNMNNKKYKATKMKNINVDNILYNKYKNQYETIRKQTKEKGLDIYVEQIYPIDIQDDSESDASIFN